MESGNSNALLAHTVKRFLNGYLYTHYNQNRLKGEDARRVVREMEHLEDTLRELGTTDRQMDGLLNYGQVLISVLWTEITDAGLKHILKLVFEKEVEISL